MLLGVVYKLLHCVILLLSETMVPFCLIMLVRAKSVVLMSFNVKFDDGLKILPDYVILGEGGEMIGPTLKSGYITNVLDPHEVMLVSLLPE